MKLLYHPAFLDHDTGMHPENKKRLEAFGNIPTTEVPNGEGHLLLFHTPEYIQQVKDACRAGRHMDADTVTSAGSYEAAVRAVGATIMASQTGDFALVRPPGHHAHPGRASGFCLFNNISVAVQKLVNEGKRVFIFDFDGHLGDGTEEFFYSSNRVLYWSLHQYPAFPGSGTANEVGEAEGTGFTINVPLPPGTGDDLYLQAVTSLLPIAVQFTPDIVAVSAGFDGYKQDPLLNLRLSVNTYYALGELLREKWKSLFATLEGGYNVQLLPRCLQNFLDGVNGKSQTYTEPETISSQLIKNTFTGTLETVLKNVRPFWNI